MFRNKFQNPDTTSKAMIEASSKAARRKERHRTRQASAKFPDFIIAGFSKCGTTGLRATLSGHPEVDSNRKELHFFDTNTRWSWGLEWYQDHFSGPCAGESTPAYVYSRRTMQRIADTIPAVRLIFCVRNPVDRLYSWYQHKIERKRIVTPEELPFSAFRDFPRKLRSYDPLQTGCYARLIRENVLPLFRRDQCLFVIQERLKQDPHGEVERVMRFLGVTPVSVPIEKRKESTYRAAMPADVRAELVEYYRPYNAEFYELAESVIPEWDR